MEGPCYVILRFLTLNCVRGLLAGIIVLEEESEALHDLEMPVFRLAFEREQEIADADGELDHGVSRV